MGPNVTTFKDARGHTFDPTTASEEDWLIYLLGFNSYARTEALWQAMMFAHRTPELNLRWFLRFWSVCDRPWEWRGRIAELLREACAKVALLDVLEPEERAFFSALPPLVSVWRGCEGGRERGLSWTTDQQIATKFAFGQRCRNSAPTFVRAEIPKQHVFGVFLSRQESELVVDYRRLRKIIKESLPSDLNEAA